MQNKIKSIIYLSIMYVTIINNCSANENNNNHNLNYYNQASTNLEMSAVLPGNNGDGGYDDDNKNEYLITTANNYLKIHEYYKAAYTLKYLDYDKLTDKQSVQLRIIQAKIYINSDIPQLTQNELDIINNEPSNINDIVNNSMHEETVEQIAVAETTAQTKHTPTYTLEHQLNTSRAIPHNFQNSYDPNEKNNSLLWRKLIIQDKPTLETLIANNQAQHERSAYDAVNNTMLGWLELAKLTKESPQNSNSEYFRKIQNWQNKFREHPAKNYLAELQLDLTPLTLESYRPKKIVALLPLTGNLAPAARAIKDGILTAYFNDKNTKKPEIIFIDTHNNSKEIKTHYQQALANNPDLIIGPLDKPSVQKLNNIHNQTIPIIALNYISDNLQQNNNSNFFQFGISAEDEAIQAAIKTQQSGFTSTLIIVDDTDWGYRVSKAFEDQFEALNGMVTHVAFLNSKPNYKKLIYASLGLESSNTRKNTLQSVLGSELAFQPRRRQDFDNIFLVTSSTAAKQIKPLLKFYYAGNIPILATSNIIDYKYSQNNLHIKDLDGIKFCDIPLILQNTPDNTELIETLRKTWPNNYNNLIRLYALGIDSYNLIYNLTKLTALQNIGISGNTGHLIVDNNGKINRQLPWAEINNNGFKMIDVI
jgi:outer membrane PBP1 activator LpoA protein